MPVINKFYLLCVIFSGSPDLTLKTCLVLIDMAVTNIGMKHTGVCGWASVFKCSVDLNYISGATVLNRQIGYLELNVKLQDYHLLYCDVVKFGRHLLMLQRNVNKFTSEYLVSHFRRSACDFCETLQSHSSDIWCFCGSENLDGDCPAYYAM